ncbi:hypothetical protein DFH08DRAFT_1077185 [Mycena albidolilacea]|uniref:F-box domain-containing protein n=1 Tax=Mycena albidolilacea TaxID=1033008 RepID=A0AAD7ABU9_9AGAR|nr:hypothetical protein DFH08DRAFT_1077185 [Mycena albidolilacea]
MGLSSPFASRLGTNYIPPDGEVLEIQSLLVEPKAISELNEERSSVADYVDAHRALISPVRRLPLDMLQEIFVACLPTHRNCVMSASEAPVLLGRICSSWRTVSLSTARLWARLHIVEPAALEGVPSLDIIREQKHVQRVGIAKAWLERSGQCPLSISVAGSMPPDPTPPQYSGTNLILQTLIPFASRWQDISLAVSLPTLESLSSITGNDVPILKTLNVKEFRERSEQPSPQWGSFGLLHGPNISSFSCLRSKSEPLGFSLRWDQLTSLSLTSVFDLAPHVTSDLAVAIFSKCPRLETCRLVVSDYDESPVVEPWRSILELPCLLSLDIHCYGSPVTRIGGLFSYILLPELRHLGLRGFLAPEDSDNFTYFLFPTISPRLESLEVDTQLFNKQALVALLTTLSSTIRHLRFTGRQGHPSLIEDAALAALIPSESPERSFSCPILQEFRLICAHGVSDEALLRFIKARMSIQPPTLHRVELEFVRRIQLDIRPDIQPFLDAGLEVDLNYPPAFRLSLSPWAGLAEKPPNF